MRTTSEAPVAETAGNTQTPGIWPGIGQNPFSLSRVASGDTPFVFESEHMARELTLRFEAFRYRGIIVGPHGSGKSTLARWLAREYADVFGLVVNVTFRKAKWGALTVAKSVKRTDSWRGGSGAAKRELWLIDGWERLNLVQRSGLNQLLVGRDAGILITRHHVRDWMSSVLIRLTPQRDVFYELVRQFQIGFSHSLPTNDVTDAWTLSQGDFRQGFAILYDRYEQLSQGTL